MIWRKILKIIASSIPPLAVVKVFVPLH